ncbi:AMP-binding protein, partial [Bacillus sp. WP8]|uniref:AMP-binding protein n=1 Tax=Bacillus sp. WP8 TaxID=756828 RepID=UPI0021B4D0DC
MELGVEKGDDMAMMGGNVGEWVMVEFGWGWMGAVVVRVNRNFEGEEVGYLVKDCDRWMVFMVEGFKERWYV